MYWILIIWLSSTTLTILPVEFQSEEACISTGMDWAKSGHGRAFHCLAINQDLK